MSGLLNRLKRSLICFAALATSASMLAPVSVYATETTSEVDVDNHTQGRDDARTVSGITIGDVDAPKEGVRLDEKAVVTTAEGETWEIPVIWIGEDLKPDTGLAGKGSYLPVLAYVVPDEYTVKSSDVSGRGYKITLSEDLLKLFGENKIISVYESKTGITFILPAKLKDLFAKKGTVKNPTDEGGNEIVPADQVAPFEEEAEEEPAQEQEEEAEQEEEEEEEEKPQEEDDEEETYSRIVNVHCDANAKEALSASDLEFLADLVVNTLQPQAVNLLIEKFPALKTAAANKEIGNYLAVVVSYNKDTSAYGYSSRGIVDDDTYPNYKFVYSLTVNSNQLTEHTEDGKTVIARDTGSKALTDLANTIVHELFHCVSYDYNRPGLTGLLYDGNTLQEYSSDVEFPVWFKEGTASTVENNWQFRQGSLKIMRTPFGADSPQDNYSKDLLVQRYVGADVDGEYTSNYIYDIGGNDSLNYYVGGYLACMYLYELAASGDSSIGTSISESGGNIVVSSEKLRLGMNSIIERMHKGETLDQVINSISAGIPGGAYKDTADFEARFIKGVKDEDGKYDLAGDPASVDFVYEFMSYMNRIDQAKERGERNDYANGSVLFDFETDFRSPLSFEGTYSTSVLQPLDDDKGNFQRYSRSTVGDRQAYSTGGKSESGTPVSTANSISNILTFTAATAASGETADTQEAAKEADESVMGSTGAAAVEENSDVVITTDAEPVFDEASAGDSSVSETSSEGASVDAPESSSTAAEAASETGTGAASVADAGTAASETEASGPAESEADASGSADTAIQDTSAGESAVEEAAAPAEQSVLN